MVQTSMTAQTQVMIPAKPKVNAVRQSCMTALPNRSRATQYRNIFHVGIIRTRELNFRITDISDQITGTHLLCELCALPQCPLCEIFLCSSLNSSPDSPKPRNTKLPVYTKSAHLSGPALPHAPSVTHPNPSPPPTSYTPTPANPPPPPPHSQSFPSPPNAPTESE